MRVLGLCSLLSLAGCGSYWDLRAGEELAIGCATLLNYYVDEDGDNWGDPSVPPTPLCEPDEGQKLTAANNLDCDDLDPTITGQVGAVCPQNMDPGGTPDFVGLIRGDSEYVAVYGETLPARFTIAEDHCGGWSGATTTAEAAAGHRGLAVLETEAEFNEVASWLESSVEAPFAAFVGTSWDGDALAGEWLWQDGSADFNFIGFCGGLTPTVADFYPYLIAGDEDALDALNNHADEVRLALVYDGASWCLGLPSGADDPDYDEQTAHYVCERPRPDLADYADKPGDGEVGGDDGPPGPGE